MLRQASDDGDAFDSTNLYALPLGTPVISAAPHATASRAYSSSGGSRSKNAGMTVSDPNVIHVQTEISVETRPTWVDLIGVNI